MPDAPLPQLALSQPSLPQPPSALTRAAAQKLREIASRPDSAAMLEQALRFLAKWRAELLANTLVDRSGDAVLSGPFKGMTYLRSTEGSRSSRLIGAYEASLVPVIEAIVAARPDVIVDVGSAEGYYAVGLARRLPGTRVLARDGSLRAQKACAALAAANGVVVEVGGLMTPSDFALCSGCRAVVICDIEGAEDALLDPFAGPGLLQANILVEVHEGMVPGLTLRLTDRFAASHKITRIDRKIDDSGLPDWMEALSDLDRLLALWEWRSGPTPWLWMEAR